MFSHSLLFCVLIVLVLIYVIALCFAKNFELIHLPYLSNRIINTKWQGPLQWTECVHPPPQIYVKTLLLGWWYLEMGIFGRRLAHEVEPSRMGSVHWSEEARELTTPLHRRRYTKKLAAGKPGRGSSLRTEPRWHPALRLPAFRTVRNKCLLFIRHPDYDIFVRAAHTDSDRH